MFKDNGGLMFTAMFKDHCNITSKKSVLFGIILLSCIITRTSAFLLRAVNYLACVDC